jgi:hypothetical protein
LTETDERDEAHVREAGAKRSAVFGGEAGAHFAAAMTMPGSWRCDGVVLTGDMIDFPTRANLELLASGLRSLSVPYTFTMGNHDWKHDGERPSDELRQTAYPLLEEAAGVSPWCSCLDIGGVKAIAIDNSNYQIGRDQLDYVKQQAASGLPWLLFLHIPLYVPSLAPQVVEVWGSPIMMGAAGWDPDKQQRWGVREAEPATMELLEWVASPEAGNLLGIFCGHVHFAHRDAFAAGKYQYVTRPGFKGGYRKIIIQPLQQHGSSDEGERN